jgi:hypothetical protein
MTATNSEGQSAHSLAATLWGTVPMGKSYELNCDELRSAGSEGVTG